METTENVVEGQSIALNGLKPVSAVEQVYHIPVSRIIFSPINYRGFYSEQELSEFAEQLKADGEILHPVIVRPRGKKYELVIGERRLRAARIAELKVMPARIRELSDEQVRRMALNENLHREDPHPLREATGILELQQTGLTLEEVARTLGKSMAFIHNRIKLTELIRPLQELYFAGKLTNGEAVELGGLAADSQEDFYREHCEGWQEKKHFGIGNTKYLISRYKYDLKQAPFDTKSKSLVPEAGACGVCPYNSATLKTLFPELAKQAVCSNKACFVGKCQANAEMKIRAALTEFEPLAILTNCNTGQIWLNVIDTLPETMQLPRHDLWDVKVFGAPEKPVKENYKIYDDEKNKEVFDRQRYSHALQEYREDLQEYQQTVNAEETLRGIAIRDDQVTPVYFNPSMRSVNSRSSATPVTAKEVQQAMKEGSATPELLTGEVQRIKGREARKQEIDRQKVQDNLFDQFKNALELETLTAELSEADNTAMRFVVYNSLPYGSKSHVGDVLFPKGYKDHADLFNKLAKLTDKQFAFLVRMAVVGSGESKNPQLMHGYCLYQMAEADGLDVAAIELSQAEIANARQERVKERVKGLQVQIRKLKTKKAA